MPRRSMLLEDGPDTTKPTIKAAVPGPTSAREDRLASRALDETVIV